MTVEQRVSMENAYAEYMKIMTGHFNQSHPNLPVAFLCSASDGQPQNFIHFYEQPTN